MKDRNRDQRERYQRLKAEGKCVQCIEPLVGRESKGVRCLRCYQVSYSYGRVTGRKKEKSEQWKVDLEKILATSQNRSASQQAADYGFRIERVYALRAAARRQGHEIPHLGVDRAYKGESSKWAQLDALMSTPCKRCGLRGEHECIQVDSWSCAGDGRPYPAPGGCGFTTAEKVSMRTVESKFIRFTNAKREAMKAGR